MLCQFGITGVKAEALALQLGATKGSFYWHFKDVPALHGAMLALWRNEATASIIAAINEDSSDGPARLIALTRMIAALNANNDYGGTKVEPAIRDWARFNLAAGQAVRHVDTERLEYLQNLYGECGMSLDESAKSAQLYYACYVGMQTLTVSRPIDVASKLETLVTMQLLQAKRQA